MLTLHTLKQYLVIAELENNGYIIRTTTDPQEAKDKSSELFILADQIPFNELYKFNDHLSEFQSYPINGNAMHLGKDLHCTSNGSLSVYILEISESFSIRHFISERSNTSYAVISDGTEPEVMFYAN